MIIDAPLVVDDPEREVWHESADVVVVGFGGAGAVAAIEARQQGARVLVLEHFAGGGATAASGGIFYGGATRYQREGGVSDTAEDMYRYLWEEGVPVKPETLRKFCQDSDSNLGWLASFGIPYSGTPYFAKCALPPDGHYLYYTGNEKHPRFAAVATPAPRGHRVVTDGFGGGLYFSKLRQAVLDLGATVRTHCPVKRLVTDRSGRVIGVELQPIPKRAWERQDHLAGKVKPWAPMSGGAAEKAIAANAELEKPFMVRQRVRALNGVILCTGGFIYNLDMLRQYRPEIARTHKAVMRLGTMGCDGSGIRLGESVGGASELLSRVCVSRNIAPPQALVSGILVNAEGKRFVNEDVYVGGLGDAVVAQATTPNSRMWLLIESKDFWRAFKAALRPGKNLFMLFGLPTLLNMFLGGTRRGGSLRGIAKKCGIDAAGLERTVAEYNSAVQTGQPDAFGKAKEYVHTLGNGSYYALNMALENPFSFTMAFTLGGLKVNEETGAVLRADGSSIAGLYAAGRAAVGMCSRGYQSGMSIADTVFSGRRAARAASPSSMAQDRPLLKRVS